MINDTINDLEMMGIQVQSFILQVSGNDYPVCQPSVGMFLHATPYAKTKQTQHTHMMRRGKES